jgi:hypothetical protein
VVTPSESLSDENFGSFGVVDLRPENATVKGDLFAGFWTTRNHTSSKCRFGAIVHH